MQELGRYRKTAFTSKPIIMITYKTGNLLDAKVAALVNTVNTVGVMGKAPCRVTPGVLIFRAMPE